MIILDPGENGHFEAALVTRDGAIHGPGTLDSSDIATELEPPAGFTQIVKGRRKYFQTVVKHPMPKTQSEILAELSSKPPQII